MIEFFLSEIAPIIHAEWIGKDKIIKTVTIDSNKIYEQCLFVALRGKRLDGHNFVEQAIFNGACAVLVDYYLKLDIPQLVVTNTKYALSQLGAWVRRQVSSKIIVITGSSGKTSVKEMTLSILSLSGKSIATQKNFNNEIGVSLTLLRLTHTDSFAIIELGTNNFGEIKWINSLIQPDIVLVNNIFPAHLSSFGSLYGVAEAKGEIFLNLSNFGTCVLNVDNNAWLFWMSLLLYRPILRFSVYKKDGVDFFASSINYNQDNVDFILHTPYGNAFIRLYMFGMHSVSNALAASALAFSAGATLDEIVLGLEKVCAIPGRLFPISLARGKLLIDDSYNANIGSMVAAIDVLRKIIGYRIIVVGDIAELGSHVEVKYHQDIGKLISKTNIHYVLSIGYLSYFISYCSGRGEHFYNENMLIIRLLQFFNTYNTITVLIKGSRNMMMERLLIILQERLYDSWVN